MIQDEKRQQILLYTTLVANCMANINTSTVNIALPTFMQIFQTDLSTAQWLMTGYMLALAMAMPLVGYFGDRYSYRRLYLTALVLVAVFTLGCAVSQNIWMLITFRILKGLAAGFILPCSMTLIYRYIPREKQASYLGLSVAFSSLGSTLGPSISGFLLTFFNWHSLFLVNLPLVSIAYALAKNSIPAENGVKQGHIDIPGLCFMAVGTILVLIGFSCVTDWGWVSTEFLICLAAGISFIVVFIWMEQKSREPVLNFMVLTYQPFAVAVMITLAVNITFTITPLLMAIYLQTLQGYSAFEAGIIMIIPAFTMLVATGFARKLIKFLSNRYLILLGLALAVLGNYAMHNTEIDSPLYLIIPMLSLRYFGLGMLNMPLSDYGMKVLPAELSGHGSSMLGWCKQIAMVVWLNIMTAVLTISTNFYLGRGMQEAQASMCGVNTVFFVLACVLGLVWIAAFILTRKV